LLLRLAYWLIEKSPKLAFNESINSRIIAKHTTGNLRDLTKEQATQYLVDRSIQVGQSSLKARELEVLTHKITEWLKRYARFDVLLLLLFVQVEVFIINKITILQAVETGVIHFQRQVIALLIGAEGN
jgi:hypothetical protein